MAKSKKKSDGTEKIAGVIPSPGGEIDVLAEFMSHPANRKSRYPPNELPTITDGSYDSEEEREFAEKPSFLTMRM